MSHCRSGGREWGFLGRQSKIQVHVDSGCPSSADLGKTCFPDHAEVITSAEVVGVS